MIIRCLAMYFASQYFCCKFGASKKTEYLVAVFVVTLSALYVLINPFDERYL